MHILMITRHFPPEVSGGARRPYLYTKELRALGHKVTIISPFAPAGPDQITVPNTSIDKGIANRAAKSAKNEVSLSRKVKTSIREWMLWPDPDISWSKDVVRAARNLAFSPDIIFTTSPPESVHLAGAAISKALKRPWIAEMRDTWVEVPHRVLLENSKIRARIERRIAKKAFSHASAVTTVSAAIMNEAEKYIASDIPRLIISHFSDETTEQFTFDPTTLNLLHTGGFTLSDRRRKIKPLLNAIQLVAKNRPEIALHVAGPVTAEEIDISGTYSFQVIFHGLVALSTSKAMQANADGLVLYTPQNSHALPGKFAEYHVSGRPILYMGGGDWLDLLPNQECVRPLHTALPKLEKNETVPITNALTSAQAAKSLSKFLENLI